MLGRADSFFLRLLAALLVGLGAAGRESDDDRSFICSVPGANCEAAALTTWKDISGRQRTITIRSDVQFHHLYRLRYTDAPNSGTCIAMSSSAMTGLPSRR